MSVIDEVIEASKDYAKKFNLGHLPMPPARKIAVVACMDARLMVDQILGLKTGDAHVIRNAGGIINEDSVRSLIISHYLLGTQEFVIINHTDCGMLTFKDEDLHKRLHNETGAFAIAPDRFYAFNDVEKNVKEQVKKLKSHPWIPKQIKVKGFIYDVKHGTLKEVSE